jgi:hypothetical protein
MAPRFKLPCPSCGDDIKLRRVSPPSDPIQKYPAVRPCPSCRAALRLDLPGWVMPSLTGFMLALCVIPVFLVDSTNAPFLHSLLQADRSSKKLAGALIAIPVMALALPVMIVVMRREMRVTLAG